MSVLLDGLLGEQKELQGAGKADRLFRTIVESFPSTDTGREGVGKKEEVFNV